jgi:S-adenosylhomocysteine hydrolase
MKITSDDDGLILTSTINIYAQKLHQLGQIVFNYKGEFNEQYYECIKKMQSTCNNIKEKIHELHNKIEEEMKR